MNKNIVVFGVGAVGGCIAAYLARLGYEIDVIDPWFTNVVAIQKRGLHVTDADGEFTIKLKALHVDQICEARLPIDILFLSVKSYDTEWATRYIAPYLASDGFIVSAQNSLNEEIISSIVGSKRTMGLVVGMPASIWEPGEPIRHTAVGDDKLAFTLGELDGTNTTRLEEMAKLMSKIGQTRATDNIWGALWSKLGLNCMLNATGGLTGLTVNAMFKNPTVRKLLMQIGREIVIVGEAHDIKFGNLAYVSPENFKKLDKGSTKVIEEAMLKNATTHRTGIRDSRPSLLQDILKGRRTEIDFLNGLTVRKGKEKGILTPVNKAMVEAVRRVEEGEIKPNLSNLEVLKKLT